MKIKNEKYQQEFINSLFNIFEKSPIDVDFYQRAAFSSRNASDEEKQEFIDIIKEAKPLEDNDMSDCMRALNFSFMLLEANQCPQWSKKILQVMAVIGAMDMATVKYTEIKTKEEKSNAGKKRVSLYKPIVLQIAQDTLKKYPDASPKIIADQSWIHLKSLPENRTVPTLETFKDWLRDSNLFDLVNNRNTNISIVLSNSRKS